MENKKLRQKISCNYKNISFQDGILTIKSSSLDDVKLWLDLKAPPPEKMSIIEFFKIKPENFEDMIDATVDEMGSLAMLGDSVLKTMLINLFLTNFKVKASALSDLTQHALSNRVMALFIREFTDLKDYRPIYVNLSDHYLATIFEYFSALYYLSGNNLLDLVQLYMSTLYHFEFEQNFLAGIHTPLEVIIEKPSVAEASEENHGRVLEHCQCEIHPEIRLIKKTCAKYFACCQTEDCTKSKPCMNGSRFTKCALCLKNK